MTAGANEVSLRPLDPSLDRALLEHWLELPHVVRWWGDPDVQLKSSLNRPPGADHVVIYAGEVPVGYLRWQPANIEYLESLDVLEVPRGAMDIDIYLGEPDYVGQGIGTVALRILLAMLTAEPDVPAAGMSVSLENAAAIRCYEKAGFQKHVQYQDPDFGPCWIMMTRFH